MASTLNIASRTRRASTSGWLGRAVFLTELLLILGLAYVAARLIWLIAFGASAAEFEVRNDERAQRSSGSAFVADISRLRDVDLFADRRDTSVPTIVQQDDIPETQLNLVLRGIRRGETETSGGAIIQTPDNRQAFVGVGREIMDGVTLEEVHDVRVIINRRGIRESLYIREAAQAREEARRAAAEAAAAETGAETGDAPAASPAIRRNTAGLRNGQRHQVAGFEFTEVLDSGQLSGFRLTGGSEAVLGSMGLRMGDIVTGVDGRDLERIDDVAAIFNTLANRDEVRLNIVRGGLALTLEVELP